MAVNNETTAPATNRRLFFGANVIVVVLLAVIVLVAVNLLGHTHNKRKDLAGGLASHRLSERTKGILNQVQGDMTVTSVYTSDEPDSDRKTYLPRLQDYLEEMREYKRNVKVDQLHNGNERAALRDRIQSKFGTAAEKYKEVVDNTGRVWDNLLVVLKNIEGQTREASGSWLSGFTILASIQNDLHKDQEAVEEVRREVNELVRGEGIPRYQEANKKIKEANDAFKTHLEALQTWTKDTNKLVGVLSQSNSEFATKSKENLVVLNGLLLNLRKSVGDLASREVPADPLPLIKDYTKAANALSKWLFDEYNRVGAFVKENPGLEQHPKWNVLVKVAIFDASLPLHKLLEQCSQQLSQNVQVLRGVLSDSSKASDLDLKNLVLELRQNVAATEKNLGTWTERLQAVLADAGKIDEKSKQFLAKGVSGDLFAAPVPSTQPDSKETKSIITQLTGVGTKIGELPKLELDEIAEKMKDDNIVVIETDKLVRIVPFDEVWPAASPDMGMSGQDKGNKLHRVFDGDRAVSSAINGLMNTKKVATVILVAYETEPPPQMRQFQRPQTGPIPLAQLSVLKDRLTKANFSVKDWNLGAQGEDAKKGPPAPDEGTQAIYVFLPPAEPPPQNPMMGQPPQQGFGPEQMKQVKDVLEKKDARAIFLAMSDAMPRRPFDPPANYAYRDLLRDDWGVDVKFEYRVIRGVRDLQRPDHFNIDIGQWRYMPLSNFSDHPIGKPLKARRLLMFEVCPVTAAGEKLPDNVKVSPVLEIPATAQDIWADSDILRIIKPLMEGQRDSSFTKGPNAMDQGFPVVVASENSKTSGKIVVMGNGLSFIDAYVSRPVMHLEGRKGAILTSDPAPTENIDLVLNTLFWMADQPNMIASGPAPVPLVGPIDSTGQASIISFGWAFVVLFLGVVVMFVRRK